MSDTKTVTVVVNRNGLDNTFAKQVFGKKSEKNAGKEFFAPVIALPVPAEVEIGGVKETVLTNVKDLLWIGVAQVVNFLEISMRRVAADVFLDCIVSAENGYSAEEITQMGEGSVDWEEFKEQMADFTAGGTTIKQLEEQIDNLQALSESIINSPGFGDNSEASLTMMAQIKENAQKLGPLREQKAQIEAEYKVRSAKRKASKEAKKAAAALAAQQNPTGEVRVPVQAAA